MQLTNEMEPYVLFFGDLPQALVQTVLSDFHAALVDERRLCATRHGRPTTREEFLQIRRNLTARYNTIVIPRLAARVAVK